MSRRSPRASRNCRSTARRKAKSEALVERSGLDWAIVRPPAVYGPGDKETLELFKMAKRGVVLLPPKGRLSLIHVDDLARLLLALAEPDAPSGLIVEPDDGRRGGWSHKEFAQALGTAVGRRGVSLSVPRGLMKLAREGRPAAARRQGQADPRPRRLFQPSRLGRGPERVASARTMATADSDRGRPRRNRRLVSPSRAGCEPPDRRRIRAPLRCESLWPALRTAT